AELICLAKQHKVILFNFESSAVCEKNLLLSQFNGVFYSSDAAEDIFKALVRITDGELWFTRKVISGAFKDILNSASSHNLLHDDIVLSKSDYENLTKREKSVIQLIAQGASNDKIANKLNISD
ncbi:LuxR C-terminal-related transcriptional regulator, partial [Pseudoalteromonas sp. S558]|uniref:LuxR C-terminal-related transcriptional regulator n=1 Tax=Pseudoalteromonas sp. S558 TaxID=2066515 RepID=UPI001279C6F2